MKDRDVLFYFDDTPLGFTPSERLSFAGTLTNLGVDSEKTTLFADYQRQILNRYHAVSTTIARSIVVALYLLCHT